MSFLPITKGETPFDVILVTPEAYVDHPSFGHAIISRLLQHCGISVGILAQPLSDNDYKKLGEPKHGFFISGGVVDSMVNNYTVAKMKRSEDSYSEGGRAGMRPDRCVSVYTKNIKRIFGAQMPVVIGGIEASLRRFAHYDYWSDSVMPSILVDSGADLLIYGMGERPIKEIAEMLKKNIPISKIRDIRGTSFIDKYDGLSQKLKEKINDNTAIFCPSFAEVSENKLSYVKAFNVQQKNNDHISGKIMLQKHDEQYVVQNPPQLPLSPAELDEVYALEYERTYHPIYTAGVPAIEEVKFSISSHRGCFGGCNYCALTYHQGRIIQKRSKESIIEEAQKLVSDDAFKGYIHDVGGPTANFRNTACKKQLKGGVCADKQCIGSTPCENLEVSHTEYLDILRTLREIEGVKKVFIRSGIRFDYLMMDKDDSFMRELITHHISGQLKVAPEHCVESVLENMNKPDFSVYLKFKEKYEALNKKLGKNQFLVPYLISSHPGCTLRDAVRLAEYLKSVGHMPEQVQDFYPTPSTKSTCMYYTGINPDTMKEVYVPRERDEKKLQRALLQYRRKDNYPLILTALKRANREDLIGFGENCLIKPTKEMAIEDRKKQNSKGKSGASKGSIKASSVKNGSKMCFMTDANGKPSKKSSVTESKRREKIVVEKMDAQIAAQEKAQEAANKRHYGDNAKPTIVGNDGTFVQPGSAKSGKPLRKSGLKPSRPSSGGKSSRPSGGGTSSRPSSGGTSSRPSGGGTSSRPSSGGKSGKTGR